MKRTICYVTGTRADFGLMQGVLQAIQQSPRLELSIVATGTHFHEKFGMTVRDIEAAGLPVSACIEVDVEPATGATMARNIGRILSGLVDFFNDTRPDIVMLLGDRGEMLAGALAAIHLNIPVVHVHGGERSGTVDEPVRHAISKLAHVHFAATEQARDRLIRMGEASDHVFVTGAPGVDGLSDAATVDRAKLFDECGFDPGRPAALLIYHPVLQEEQTGAGDVATILSALSQFDFQVLALRPNSDAGSDAIRAVFDAAERLHHVRVLSHLPRGRFVSWMAAADLMLGNSSSGIIEAASFGTPVINIGSRQNLRERNANVMDVVAELPALRSAIQAAMNIGRFPCENLYGDGNAATRMVALLEGLVIDDSLLLKANAY